METPVTPSLSCRKFQNITLLMVYLTKVEIWLKQTSWGGASFHHGPFHPIFILTFHLISGLAISVCMSQSVSPVRGTSTRALNLDWGNSKPPGCSTKMCIREKEREREREDDIIHICHHFIPRYWHVSSRCLVSWKKKEEFSFVNRSWILLFTSFFLFIVIDWSGNSGDGNRF